MAEREWNEREDELLENDEILVVDDRVWDVSTTAAGDGDEETNGSDAPRLISWRDAKK